MTVKQVAITGAGRGIGRALTQKFLDSGWRVWALVRQENSLDELSHRGDIHPISFDANSEASVLEAARRLTTEAGHLTALINNAGVALSAPLHKTSTAEYE